jgi:hypothetical protein
MLCGEAFITEELGEAASAGGEGELVLGAVLGTAQVGADSDTGALGEKVLDGGNRSTDACS